MGSDPQVIIIGGGVFGCSTAYHLATKGCKDVLLLEAREIGSQSTSQAAGFIRVLHPSVLMTRIAQYAIKAFERFEEEVGHKIGFQQLLLRANEGSKMFASYLLFAFDDHLQIQREFALVLEVCLDTL